MENTGDLNIEMAGLPAFKKKHVRTREIEGLCVSETEIKTEAEAREASRRAGYYATVTDVPANETERRPSLIRALAELFGKALSKSRVSGGKILVAGLGNSGLTADALGAKVLEKLAVGKCDDFEVCTLAPMVGAVTGVASFDVVKGVSDRIKPAAVIAVDSLATYTPARLCSCYQITNAGISPGSGVGDAKPALCADSLGVPVIAAGVPFVAKASGLAEFYASRILNGTPQSDAFLKRLSAADNLVVTPKDVDDCVDAASDIIAGALNLFFFGRV